MEALVVVVVPCLTLQSRKVLWSSRIMDIDVDPHSNPHFKITATCQRSLSIFFFLITHCPILGKQKGGNFTQKRRKHRHTFCFIERL